MSSDTDTYDVIQTLMRYDTEWANVRGRCSCPDRIKQYRVLVTKDEYDHLIDATVAVHRDLREHIETSDGCVHDDAEVNVVLEPIPIETIDVDITVGGVEE